MPTLIAGVVAVILLYSLLQMFRAANPVVLARAIKIVGGVVALAVAAFTGADDLDRPRHLRRGPARLVAVRCIRVWQFWRDIRRFWRAALAGSDFKGPLPVSRHDARP